MHSIFDVFTIHGNRYRKGRRIRLKIEKTKLFFDKQLKQWLSIITETSKIQCRIVIPQVSITFFQFKSTWTANSKRYLINNKGVNILIFHMTLDKV